MQKNLLEQLSSFLLNDEQAKAEELFHKFIVHRAREIHESLRQGDDAVLEENWGQEMGGEKHFATEDLDDVEDEHEDGAEGGDEFPMGDESGEGGEEAPSEFGGDEAGLDVDPDAMGGEEGEGSLEDRIEGLEVELERLTSEFEEILGTEGGGEDEDFGLDDEEMGGGDHPVDDEMEDSDLMPPDMNDEEEDEEGGEDHEREAPFGESEEFDDITESIVSELEKVSVSLSGNKEIGSAGKSVGHNDTSPIPQRGVHDRAKNAHPVKVESKDHTGYEREEAPTHKDVIKARNNHKSADEGRTKVTKEGDKAAELNKWSSEDGNKKSPIGSAGTGGNNGGIN